MKISLKTASIYKKIKQARTLEKVAQDGYPFDETSYDELNNDIYSDLSGLGEQYYQSPDHEDYVEYLRQLEQHQADVENTAQPPSDSLLPYDQMDDIGSMTPSEYLDIYNSNDRSPYELGMGAYQLYDNLGNTKLSSEQVNETLNEIVKVGMLNTKIKSMKGNGVKTASELDRINKDYLVSLVSELI